MFCKDSRGWHTSAAGRAHGLDWPWPSTVLGALRAAWGHGEEARSGARFDAETWRAHTAPVTLARTLVLRRRPGDASWTAAHRVWPAPADAVRLEGRAELHRLDPVPPRLPMLGRDDDAAREALWFAALDDKAKPLPAPRWWSEARLAAWLVGCSVPASDPAGAFDAPRRVQAHVALDADALVAADGKLYLHDVIETLESKAEWAIGAELHLPGGAPPTVARLGSGGRLARIESLTSSMFEPPEALLDAFRAGARGLRLVVASPACFANGWLPDGFRAHGEELRGRLGGLDAELVLRAAIVSRPVNVSGWDLAAGALKPASRMVAPGAVYFFERTDRRSFGVTEARALWLAALGARTDEGFGRVLPGAWTPGAAESPRITRTEP